MVSSPEIKTTIQASELANSLTTVHTQGQIQPSAQPSNRFPNCVLMKLHSSSVQVEQSEKPSLTVPSTQKPPDTTAKQTDLKLTITIRFGLQTIKVPGADVEFGLKRGELDLKFTNGRIPLEKMGLKVPFELEVEVEESKEAGRESELDVTLTGGVKGKDTRKTTTKKKYKHNRVTNRGTEENPNWEFRMEPNLIGQLTEELLGTVERQGSPCCVEATFTVQGQSDVALFDASGLLKAKNLSRNKTALITREFFLRFIAPRLHPYLSRMERQL